MRAKEGAKRGAIMRKGFSGQRVSGKVQGGGEESLTGGLSGSVVTDQEGAGT